MKKSLLPPTLFLVLSLIPSCAQVQLDATYRSMGEFSATRDATIQSRYVKLRDQRQRVDERTVSVLVDAIPKGLSLKDGVISIEKGFQHRILGKFVLGPDSATFPSYQTSWRKYYCYPQKPLTWVTLGLWGLVPTYYPCWQTGQRSKSAIIESVRQLVVSSGGTTAIISFTGDQKLDEAWGAQGFIIQLDPRLRHEQVETSPQKVEEQLAI